MAYKNKEDYEAYQKEYLKRLVVFTVKLHKEKDSDIIEAIGDNKMGNMKRLVRMGLSVKEN